MEFETQSLLFVSLESKKKNISKNKHHFSQLLKFIGWHICLKIYVIDKQCYFKVNGNNFQTSEEIFFHLVLVTF